LLWELALATRFGNLLLQLALATCFGNLLWELALVTRFGNSLWQLALATCFGNSLLGTIFGNLLWELSLQLGELTCFGECVPKLPDSTWRKQAIFNKGSLSYSHCATSRTKLETQGQDVITGLERSRKTQFTPLNNTSINYQSWSLGIPALPNFGTWAFLHMRQSREYRIFFFSRFFSNFSNLLKNLKNLKNNTSINYQSWWWWY
jgi:hypothetical protein